MSNTEICAARHPPRVSPLVYHLRLLVAVPAFRFPPQPAAQPPLGLRRRLSSRSSPHRSPLPLIPAQAAADPVTGHPSASPRPGAAPLRRRLLLSARSRSCAGRPQQRQVGRPSPSLRFSSASAAQAPVAGRPPAPE
ncbi:hypothetical protein PVAP13_5KG461600 [Panicum virgatum]|uniref:Uncharacterized protein n=1 Tax=Panicum virgatum TaxID=38727 RepID=A0A8T0SKZ8_PANVG|nr:hypothetical protein PVAP13_5KG461600 [Panicum virgatum]